MVRLGGHNRNSVYRVGDFRMIKPISKLVAIDMLDAVDRVILNHELHELQSDSQRNDREMVCRYYLEDYKWILLEVYWARELVKETRFNRADLTLINTIDDDFGESKVKSKAIVSKRVIAENQGCGTVSFTVMPEPITQVMDVARARVFDINFSSDLTDNELQWLSTASFMDVVQRYALSIRGDSE